MDQEAASANRALDVMFTLVNRSLDFTLRIAHVLLDERVEASPHIKSVLLWPMKFPIP